MINAWSKIANMIKFHASKAVGLSYGGVYFAKIYNFDPIKWMARVQIQPAEKDENITGWLPVLSQWVGNGIGMIISPKTGDQCVVAFHNGEINCGVVISFCFNVDNLPPSDYALGEFWLIHNSGSKVKMKNDGSVIIESEKVNLGKTSLKKLVNSSFKDFFNQHSHPNNGSPPTQQMTDSHLTNETEAG